MGAGESKHGGKVLNLGVPEQPEEKYFGPSAKYHFVTSHVTIHHANASFFQGGMITSNVDSYYPMLAEQYGKGYRLLTFYRIPGQIQHVGGLFSMESAIPFQGIFCCYPEGAPINETFQLHIEKSIIQPQYVWSGFISASQQTVTNTQHLSQTIYNYSSRGGRLICIELTGQEQQHFQIGRPVMPSTLGCDLFFEMPLQPPREYYNYNVVCQPIHVSIRPGFAPRPEVHCDWAGILKAHLDQGWKLVEIFMDSSQFTQQRGFSTQTQLNSNWYFEKPASRMNDPTPVYQGCVVEHFIVMKQSGFSGVKTDPHWEPLIQGMGNKGWELACILETPEQKMSGLGKVDMKVVIFFQRKIIPDHVYRQQTVQGATQPYPPLEGAGMTASAPKEHGFIPPPNLPDQASAANSQMEPPPSYESLQHTKY